MAYEGVQTAIPGVVAGADLRTHQYKFVKLSTEAPATVLLCDAVDDEMIGILQDTPNIGQAANVMFQGVSKLVANAALTVGQRVGPATTGKGAVLATGRAYVLQAAGADNAVATVLLT